MTGEILPTHADTYRAATTSATDRSVGRRALYNIDPAPSELGAWGRDGIEGTYSIELPDKGFEMTVTDQVKDRIRDYGGMHEVRQDFEALVARVMSDPHGENNIDDFKDHAAGQLARLVHRVTGPLGVLMGDVPLAIKGTGLDVDKVNQMGLGRRSGLSEQFRHTLFMRRLFEENGDENARIGDGLIGVNDVFAVVKYRDLATDKTQEWMLMEHIVDAHPVENRALQLGPRADGFGRGRVVRGFERQVHPELAQYADPYNRRGEVLEYEDITESIYRDLRLKAYYADLPDSLLADLNGSNILAQVGPDGRQRYTLIDIKSEQVGTNKR